MPDRTEAPGTFLFVLPWDLHHAGGVNQVVINLYRECERSGLMRPLVLVLDWSHRSAVEKTELGCRTVHLRVKPPYVGGRRRMRGFISYLVGLPATIRDLRKLIEQYNIKVINTHYPTLEALNFAILKTSGLFRGKLLLSFHGLDIRNAARQRGIERILWRWLLRRGDALIACSDSLGRDIRTYDPIAAQALVTVRNGVDMDVLLRERQGMQVPLRKASARPYLLNVATFEHKKGQDILIKAFARIAADFPGIDLVIIGGDGPTRRDIESLIDQAGLAQRVFCFMDMPHSEVLSYVQHAAVFVLPSRGEPLGIAILEAATFGIPVIASRVDGIPEVINTEQVGILFEPEDDRGLEAAVRRLLADRELRNSIGSNLQKRVGTEFTWRKAWRDYHYLLDATVP
jgi:glycosyltransferase involved in cell wall biosynthesis